MRPTDYMPEKRAVARLDETLARTSVGDFV